MMDLTQKQWVGHAVFHPFEGFEDLRWKKAGSLKISFLIVILFFAGRVVRDRLSAFHFRPGNDRVFNIVPFFISSIALFAVWVIGNWAVCTLLDGEGTMRRICIFSSYAIIPYVASLYVYTILTHFLIHEEAVFLSAVQYLGLLWSAVLLFNAMRAVHQYSFLKTAASILLTVAAMFIIMFLCILLITLFQKVILFLYSLYTEIQYRIRV